MKQGISRCMRQASFALPGLLPSSRTHPRLAPWAALFRRFAASAPRSPPFSPANRMWRVHCFGQGPQGSVTTVTRPAQIKPRCSETETTQAPAPKERKNAAHGASRGSDADDLTKPRRGERNSRGLRADLAKQRTKLINFRVSQTFCCTRAHTSAINSSPRADVWPAGVFVASLGIVRHLSLLESNLNRPGHGTSFGKQTFPKGTFKQGPPTRIFSQFFVFRSACAESGVYPDRKAILLRVSERPNAEPPSQAVVIPNGFTVRNLLLGLLAALLLPRPAKFPMWKSSGNSVGSDH
jgi:hypothetical protein